MFIWICQLQKKLALSVRYQPTTASICASSCSSAHFPLHLFACVYLSLPVYFACALHLSVSVVLSLSTILMSASIYTYIQIYVLLSIYLDIRLRMHTGFHVHIHLCSIILTCNKILSIHKFTYSVYRKIVFFTNSLQSIPCNSHFPSIGLVGNYRATHLRKRSDLYSHYYFLYNQ